MWKWNCDEIYNWTWSRYKSWKLSSLFIKLKSGYENIIKILDEYGTDINKEKWFNTIPLFIIYKKGNETPLFKVFEEDF